MMAWFRRDRPGEFASDQKVRQVGGEPQVGKAVEQVQGEKQVGGHAVAMGLDMDRDAASSAEPPPALDQGHAFLEPVAAARPAAG